MKEAMQKKGVQGKVKALITLGAKNSVKHMSSRQWISASSIVQQAGRLLMGPKVPAFAIVRRMIILNVIAPKVPKDMVIISNANLFYTT